MNPKVKWGAVADYMSNEFPTTPIHLVEVPEVKNNVVQTNPTEDLNTYLTAQVVQNHYQVILSLNYQQLIPSGESGTHLLL